LKGESATVHLPTDTAGWDGGDEGVLIRGDYKLINQEIAGGRGVTPWRLYNIADDPGETRDLAALFPSLTNELVAELERNWK